MTNADLLQKLADDFGFEDDLEMFQESICDSVVPAICTTPGCEYTTEMEPDQDRRWCEECGNNTVVSCLILGGII